MKIFKLGLAFLCLGVLAFGKGFKLEGVIKSIDNANKTITVDSIYGDSIVVQVLPNTEIELDHCGIFGIGKYGTFKNLTEGSFVEVKLHFQNPNNGDNPKPIAREIEIECHRKPAY